jgi:anaerobic magnesium-protoporphyrin IX monomethyl ester cyclase
MKVLLVNPPITKKQVYSRYSAGAPCLPPLGLCYLGAALLQKGHDVKLIDCAAENTGVETVISELNVFSPDIVGVTSATVSYIAGKSVLDAVKRARPDIMTILGGAHISAVTVDAMRDCSAADVGVVGEGEHTLLEIVDRLEKHQPLEKVEGTLIRVDETILRNPTRKPPNLDEMPFPARHLLKDLRMYSHTPFRGARFTTTMITSRGCPFNCCYCDQSVFGRRWRAHSADYVLRELLSLKNEYGVEFISFEDDNFLLSRKRIIDICRMMIEANLKLGWSCLGRANEVDDEVLALMKKAGCRTIYVGVESGSPRVLEMIDKKLSIEDTARGIQLIKKYGISVTGSFILGIPTETRDEMDMTVKLALSLPLDGVTFFLFTPYPNTPLRELAKNYGSVSEDWRHYSGHPGVLPFVPAGMKDKDLLDCQAAAYRKFLMRPRYLSKHFTMFLNRSSLRNAARFARALISRETPAQK